MPGLFAGTPLERPVTCERCSKPVSACACPRNKAGRIVLPKDQAVRVRRERRNGKFVTVVSGLDPVASDMSAMLKQLRTRFGTGGTIKGEEMELQGDRREEIVEMFKGMGYPAKAAGG